MYSDIIQDILKYFAYGEKQVESQMILILFGRLDSNNTLYQFDIDDYYVHNHYEFNF